LIDHALLFKGRRKDRRDIETIQVCSRLVDLVELTPAREELKNRKKISKREKLATVDGSVCRYASAEEVV